MGKGDERRAKVVDFWRAVEMFEPTDVPYPTKKGTYRPVIDLREEAPLPWSPEHRYQGGEQPRAGQQWRHTVYCGVFPLESVQHLLEERFGRDDEDADDYAPGDAALFAFEVDHLGRALLESDSLSSCGWSVGRTVGVGPDSPEWLDGFEAAQERCRLLFEWLVTEPAPGPARALMSLVSGEGFLELSLGELWDLAEEVLDGIRREDDEDSGQALFPGLGEEIDAPHGRRRRVLGREELEACLSVALTISGADSFVPSTLRVASRRISDAGAAKEETRQLTVLQQRAAARDECDFPEKPPQPGESVFLNSFISEDLGRVATALREGGTGEALRTYLYSESECDAIERVDLRQEGSELLRRVLPERMPLGRWPSKDTHPLALSQQIAVNSIVDRIGDDAGIFSVNGPPGTGKTTLLRDLIAHVVVERAMALSTLARPEDAFTDPTGWSTEDGSTTVYPFIPPLTGHEIVVASANNGAVENVTREIPSVEAVDEQWLDRADFFAEIGGRVLGKPAWGTMAARLGNMTNRNHFAQHWWQGGYGERVNGRYVPPPGGMREFLKDAAGTKRPKNVKAKRWRKAVETFTDVVRKAEDLRAEQSDLTRLWNRMRKLQGSSSPKDQAELERLREQNRRAKARFGDHIPTTALLEDDAERELSSPWNDPETTRARTEVFLAALRLHQDFIEAVPGKMLRNLQAAEAVLRGRAPGEASKQAVLSAWQSLFFVVPVVSTTFASFARLFGGLGSESLGWLLVDEAGQATPQQVVGALWRSRRAVMVGDPLQLEPICTLPFTTQQALRRKYAVDEKWLPVWSSVQTLTDQVNPLGTELVGADGDEIWVGAPLRVHRRCDDPMFSVSNKVAYQEMMVHGTPQRSPSKLYRSLWIDVPNREGHSEESWVPAEGQALKRVLTQLESTGQKMNQVFVISPFRAVAKKALGIARAFGVTDGGTIHRTQGREADVVVFVLGGDPRRPGAKRWAAKKPNLVNVAASRAKRRLYVIGDHASWSRLDHFDVLGSELDTWEITL